ncbi:MAG: Rrf2 family transcriptional regulator [Polyangiaceae bacterium]|nr:Rrf2 family transcriptional regulator [Polyangiaceae bacterium]
MNRPPRPRRTSPAPPGSGPRDAIETLAALGVRLEGERNWTELLACTRAALDEKPVGAVLLMWKAREAWCLFVTDDSLGARRAADEALALSDEFAVAPDAAMRTLLVSGYLSDIRADHRAAVAWYARALDYAPTPAKQAHVRLELATALSKLGDYAEARRYFREAGQPAEGPDAPTAHVRANALSRLAVVEEVLGDVALAVKLQREAIALVKGDPKGDPDLLFAAHRRLARHHMQRQDWHGAAAAIADAAPLAQTVRRGALFLAHDRARLALLQGRHDEALGLYREVLGHLPTEPRVVLDAHADIWREVLDGLNEIFRAIRDERGADLTARALAAARELSATGIYAAQPAMRAHHLENAATTVEALRQHILGSIILYTREYVLDVVAEVARHRTTGDTVHLSARAWMLLRHLAEHGSVSSTELARAGEKVSDGAVRSAVQVLRKTLKLRKGELIETVRGRDGGYHLARDARRLPSA